ncbi:MAG: type VI secretion system tube protein Hcp [Deltaproteobacteria bacterium]|nr:type VI secretion system tube protein Hcp [Deltaproteobacteria bacterium]
MSMLAYLYMKGQKSGDVKGSITQKGREDSMGVIAVSHEIISPRDPQSGLPTGHRQHKPFVITKELDKASPILRNIMVTNENITEATIKFWTPQIKAQTGQGIEVQHYTIKLTNANIATLQFVQPNVKIPDQAKFTEYEELGMTYEKIEWTWTEGGIVAMDSWSERQ